MSRGDITRKVGEGRARVKEYKVIRGQSFGFMSVKLEAGGGTSSIKRRRKKEDGGRKDKKAKQRSEEKSGRSYALAIAPRRISHSSDSPS